ncbi:WD40 repeat domain-containing serine/threonine protein kinase [Parafrankia discariae]|uniref:WD40 repeat domain-containing serine/threonine protein kinase n=1 Tax=Parafrankia discariae TaxID=365528 RepID=UPI000362D5C3|nr:serine/threonine-protein kinase [Parafrankia discariae]
MSGNTARPLRSEDPVQLGAYRVVGRLGQGGMGAVFLGQAPDGTAVAIKVIRPELASRPEFRARFAREAESARRVRRFTTAAVLDADPNGPQPYLVTEFVEGPTLSRHVAARGPMRPADLEQLAVSVATALSAIHAAGIVHRDLTPANVLLSPVGPKVIDFGLAREYDTISDLSRNVKQAIGTPGYMSPEQILDLPITAAVDIFAWGSIMIFAATGHPPFGQGRMEAVLYRIINEPPQLDGVTGELRDLVELAMGKDPASRPSAEELRVSLMGGVAIPDRNAAPGSPGGAEGTAEASRGRRWSRGGRRDRSAATPGTAGGAAAGRAGLSGPVGPGDATGAGGPAGAGAGGGAAGSGIGGAGGGRGGSGTAAAAHGPLTHAPRAGAGPALGTPPPASSFPGVSSPGSAQPRTPSGPISQPPPYPLSPAPHGQGGQPAGGPGAGGRGWPGGPASAGPLAQPPGSSGPVSPAPGAPTGSEEGAGTGPPQGAESGPGSRRRTMVLAGFAALLVAAVVVPVVALGGGGGGDDVSSADREAVAARLAATAAASRAQDPALAARLSLAAYRIAPVQAAQDAMVASFAGASAVRTPASAVPHQDVALNPAGTVLAATGADGALRLFHLTDGGEPTLISERPSDDSSEGIAFTGDGARIATGGTQSAAHLWNVTDPANPQQVAQLDGLSRPVQVALSADGSLLAAAAEDGTFGLWNVSNPAAPVMLRLQLSNTVITDMALTPDGKLLATAGIGGDVQLWNITDPRKPSRVGVASGAVGAVNAVAFSPDGRRMVTGGDDRTVRVWDVGDPTAIHLTSELHGHTTPVNAVVFGAGGQPVSGDQAGVVAYWDISSSAPMVQVGALKSPVLALATDAADDRLALSTESGQVSVWSTDAAKLTTIACADPGARISRAEWDQRISELPFRDPCTT